MIHLQVLNMLDVSLVSVPVPPPPGALSSTEVSPQLQAKLPVKQTQPSSCPRSPVPASSHINRHFGGCSGRLGNCPELLEVRRGEKTKKPSESLNCSLLPDDVGAAHPQHSCSPSSRKTLHLDISQAFYSGQFWL